MASNKTAVISAFICAATVVLLNFLLSNPYFFIPKRALQDDNYRIAMVMPCTIEDLVMNTSMTLKTVVDSVPQYDETVLVFNIPTTLEDKLYELLPPNINSEIDASRDHLRNFFLKWTRRTPDSMEIMRASRKYEMLPADTCDPWNLLESLNIYDFMEFLRREEGEDPKNAFNFFKNITNFYSDGTSLDEMVSELPRFDIILHNKPECYANCNREIGTFSVFQDSPKSRDQDIVTFLDCDDLVAPYRSFVNLQAFKENPDIVQFMGGYELLYLNGSWGDDPNPIKGRLRNEFQDLWVVDRENILTPEDLDFDFRDPVIKEKYFKYQDDPEFLRTSAGQYNVDARDLTVAGGMKDFQWYLGMENNKISDQNYGYRIANGHSSWRHSWLTDVIAPFPDTMVGEDSRLGYLSRSLGGYTLATGKPLTVYNQPRGYLKKRYYKQLVEWNIDPNLTTTTTTTSTTTTTTTASTPLAVTSMILDPQAVLELSSHEIIKRPIESAASSDEDKKE